MHEVKILLGGRKGEENGRDGVAWHGMAWHSMEGRDEAEVDNRWTQWLETKVPQKIARLTA